MPDTLVILGGGLAGLSAAYEAKKRRIPHLLFERESRVGGLVRSERMKGFVFDYTGHLLHLKEERTKDLVLKELGLKDAFVVVQRNAWVYSHGVYTRYPFQANLFGLPSAVIHECLDGLLHAKAPQRARKGAESFEDWNLRTLGRGIYKHFMEPYNTKLWGVHPSEMTVEFQGRFVPKPSLHQIVEGALSDTGRPMGYNASFLYPKRDGIETLARGFGRQVAAHLGHEAIAIDLKRKELQFSNGLRLHYGRIISSMPLPRLVSIIKEKPQAIARAAKKLRASSVLNVNFGIQGRNVSDKHWVYVPERNFPFYRVGFYHNFSKLLAPKGSSSVYAEMSYSKERPIDKKAAPEKVRRGLIEMGILKAKDKIAATWVADIPGAYVVYDSQRTENVKKIQAFLREEGIISTGRWGNWEYAAMEDAIWQGVEAVRAR